jgi:RNA polymerase sigma factor (sigma-70 family)
MQPLAKLIWDYASATDRKTAGRLAVRLQRKISPRVRPYLARGCNYHPEKTKDLFQETFLWIHRKAGTFTGSTDQEAWRFVFKIAKARLRALWRKEKRLPEYREPEAVDEHHGSTAFGYEMDPDSLQRAREIMQRLEPGCRVLLYLRYFVGLDLKELSALLGIGVAAVSNRIRRCLDKAGELGDQRGKP